MKKILIILLCLQTPGCVFLTKAGKLKQETIELKGSISKKDEEISRLQNLLSEMEDKLKERDLKIELLRKKLEGFGVF